VYVKHGDCEDMTESEARLLLGNEAEKMTDAQIGLLLDDLITMANTLLDRMQSMVREDRDGFMWLLHSHRTGEYE
jgi:hypothetical protein